MSGKINMRDNEKTKGVKINKRDFIGCKSI